MCGIAGYIDIEKRSGAELSLLTEMADTLAHRGPDSARYFIDGAVGLGFRRLAILDLKGGDQPIYNEDRSIVLACNGEIYNYRELRHWLEQKGHRFRSNVDVEVLIHLYEEFGTGFLNKLNGQFAFVIYDKTRQKLFMARDQFGINPLYYTTVDGVLIFASEIKAILKHPLVRREVDLVGLDQMLSFPGLISPRTMFKGIHSLSSGHSLELTGSRLEVKEYWDLDYPLAGEAEDAKPESYYIEELASLFARSVRFRLQADVPVGFYLSGGLDSSLIGAMIKSVSPDILRHSFSIAFTEKDICESRYQRAVAEYLRSDHHEFIFGWPEISQRLAKMIYHCECPVKETFNTCSLALSEGTRKSDITVILSGEGADELFAGYVGYRFDQFGLRASKKYNLETALEDELREKLWGDKDIFYEVDLYAFQEVKKALYSSELEEISEEICCLNFDLVNKERLRNRHPLHQRSYLDFKLRLSDHLLSEHGDRMALANSVEARYPFLDINLVEFSKHIPPDLKLARFTEKYIIKKMAEGLLPQFIIDREKNGFRAPGSPYLLQQRIEWINDLLSYDRIKRQGFFNPDLVERLRHKYSQQGFNLHPHLEVDLLMVVISFGMWLDLFDLSTLN
jgi:asparagine synthase (glutamine-hydrolysing)